MTKVYDNIGGVTLERAVVRRDVYSLSGRLLVSKGTVGHISSYDQGRCGFVWGANYDGRLVTLEGSEEVPFLALDYVTA